ncbi:hypothetical protein KVG29_03230 [Caldicoprobacter algeriensis]|uniref:hypothetical protein n=1 Tax=Caldicoprobacter algeriensis TaxID=699281 RepID=UPI00207929DE|nr:hypothetical protein [Caldicoprobacter algeriensis]MCM8900238.1 hypothetical protein [Caldicoprobacter algeriensis]
MKKRFALIIIVAFLSLSIAMLFDSNGMASSFLNSKDKRQDAGHPREGHSYSGADFLQAFDSPEAALRFYFDTLKAASNLTERQMAALGGTTGEGLQPYEEAYRCWSEQWRRKHTYQEFLASWQGTVQVELLKLLPAGRQNGQARFFVETRHIEVTGDNSRTGIFYYTGFFTVVKTQEGWRITDGSLTPQNLAWELGGHQPWRSDPVMVAQIDGLGVGMETDIGEPVVLDNPDGTVTVKFLDDGGREKYRVVLYKPQDGMWRVLQKAGGA